MVDIVVSNIIECEINAKDAVTLRQIIGANKNLTNLDLSGKLFFD
jgi:hypothetical protein